MSSYQTTVTLPYNAAGVVLPPASQPQSIVTLLYLSGGGGGGDVASVFGRTGAVVAQSGDYTKAQVGIGNVDNTADASKPVSTAQAAADTAVASAAATDATTKANAAQTAAQTYADGKVENSVTAGHTTVAPSGDAVSTALALKAPLASPTFTGTPAAPTPSAGDNSTRLSTTAYADGAVGAETSRATAAETLLAPKANPALTGVPTAPTAAPGANSTQLATTAYADAAAVAAAVGLLDYRGTYNASVNTYPASGGSGLAGVVLKGDFWVVSTPGTLGGAAVANGDLVIALVDTPAQTAANWDLIEHDVGYAPENVANKDVDGTLAANSDTKYASQKAVKTYTDAKVADLAAKLTRTAVKTSNYTAALWDLVPCDPSGGAFTVTLPAASGGKGLIAIKVTVAGTLNLALTGSDHFNTSAGPTTGSISLLNQGILLASDGAGIWSTIADDMPLTALDARYYLATTALNAITAPAADVSLNSHKITSLTPGSAATDAATWGQLGGFKIETGGNLYHSMPGNGPNTRNPGVNAMRVTPFLVDRSCTFASLSILVKVAVASSTVRLGIYNDTGGGRPGTLLLDAGTVATTSTGVAELTISQAMTPGLYWLAAVQQGGASAVGMTGRSDGSSSVIFKSGTTPVNLMDFGYTGYNHTGAVSGALPGTFIFASQDPQNNIIPNVAVKVT